MQSKSTTRPKRLPLAQRQALILAALPTIQRVAHSLAFTFCITSLEADDLASIGILEALEALHRGIRPNGNKVSYLIGIARLAMRRYCMMHSSMITTPRKGYYPPLVVVSLDAPLSDDSDFTLLDVLAEELADDYNETYNQYLDCLPC